MPLPSSLGSLRERTAEFGSIVERLKKQQGLAGAAGANGQPSTSSSTDPRSQIEANSGFARKAADIGHGVHRTSMKLQKLAQLAKRTSMFDDPTAEVEELTGIIKQDITALNAQIAELQRLSARSKEGNKQSESHSHTVVDNLRSRLKDATQEFKVRYTHLLVQPCVTFMHSCGLGGMMGRVGVMLVVCATFCHEPPNHTASKCSVHMHACMHEFCMSLCVCARMITHMQGGPQRLHGVMHMHAMSALHAHTHCGLHLAPPSRSNQQACRMYRSIFVMIYFVAQSSVMTEEIPSSQTTGQRNVP